MIKTVDEFTLTLCLSIKFYLRSFNYSLSITKKVICKFLKISLIVKVEHKFNYDPSFFISIFNLQGISVESYSKSNEQ